MTRNDTVPRHSLFGHAEIDTAMLHELIELFEGILVEQGLDAFPRRHLAFSLHLFNDRHFLPVLQELFDALIGERVLQHHFEDLCRERADVRTEQARLHDVCRAAH